jgi:hypothetical protein
MAEGLQSRREEGPSMENVEFVTIASYPSRTAAEAIRLRLENEGFSPIMADAELVDMNWLLGNAVGWIKVQVPKSEADRAHSAIREIERGLVKSRWRRRPHLRDSDESPFMEEAERFDELEKLVYGLRLQVATLYRFLELKGLGTADELRSLMDKIDAEDGASDEEFYGDIVEGNPPETPS